MTVPHDDLLDVMEMTQKIESQIGYILKDVETSLAMSALMSATINCLLGQCKTFDDIVFYRNIFIEILDNSIRSVKIKGKE